MSSDDQGSKTKDKVLKEYEKDYLARVEKKEGSEEKPTEEPKVESNIPPDLQSFIFKTAADFETNANKDYIGHCVVCSKKIERNKMIYKKSHIFHASCFEQHGNDYQATTNLMNEERRARVDLAYLKNLKVRSDGSVGEKPPKKKNSTRKTTKKRKSSGKRTVRKRSSKRRTSRKKVRRRSTGRKTKRRR